MDVICIGPQISECTISSGVHALYDFLTGKVSLCYLPKMHPSQNLFGLLINGNNFTIFFVCNSFFPPKFIFPNLKCHSQESSWTSVWNPTWKSETLSFYFLSRYFSTSLNACPVLVFPFMPWIILKGNKRFLVIGTFSIN